MVIMLLTAQVLGISKQEAGRELLTLNLRWSTDTFQSYIDDQTRVEIRVPFNFCILKVNLQILFLLNFLLLAANFPCLIHVSRFLFRWIWKETVLDIFQRTALSLVKARREEGNSQMVS